LHLRTYLVSCGRNSPRFFRIRLISAHMLCLRTLTSSYLSHLFVSSHSIIIYHFLSQIAVNKRKGKAVTEPKKKKTRQQKEWERVLAVPDTQGRPQRGIRISEGTRSHGEQPQGEQQEQQQHQQQAERQTQQQQPRRSGRGHQTTEQSETPPSLARSGPRTRGGHTQPQPTPQQRRAAAEELIEREQQALDPQLPRGPRAEAFGVYIRDLRHLPGPKIRRLRSVPEDQWFLRAREECDPRFWTILQESFYAYYTHRGSQLSQHRML
jgi:hypothetical protein